MTKVGFVGLGLMGNPMSKNLIKAGHDVRVWNRTASRADDVVAAGATAGSSPADVASKSEVIVTIVSDSDDVAEVVVGGNGVIEGAPPDSVVIDMSTISPSVTRDIASRLREKGVYMLDAPVSGGVNGAEAGTLSIMVGGDKEVFDRCMPVLEAMGGSITLCGGNGMGQTTKLANQIVGLGTLAAMCEGLVFAAKAGDDLDAVLSAFGGGAAGSWMVENLGPKVLDGDFVPGFMVDLAQKDLRLVLESAAEMNMPLFTTPIVSQIFRSTQQGDNGRDGIQAYIKALETVAGVEART